MRQLPQMASTAAEAWCVPTAAAAVDLLHLAQCLPAPVLAVGPHACGTPILPSLLLLLLLLLAAPAHELCLLLCQLPLSQHEVSLRLSQLPLHLGQALQRCCQAVALLLKLTTTRTQLWTGGGQQQQVQQTHHGSDRERIVMILSLNTQWLELQPSTHSGDSFI